MIQRMDWNIDYFAHMPNYWDNLDRSNIRVDSVEELQSFQFGKRRLPYYFEHDSLHSVHKEKEYMVPFA